MRKVGILTLIISLSFAPLALAQSALYCGDGIHSPENGEACDDGNFLNRDGCDSYCQLEDVDGPTVSYADIPNGQMDVSTLTDKFRLTFSEPVDPTVITAGNVQFKEYSTVLPSTLELSDDNLELTIHFGIELEGNTEYAILIQFLRDQLNNYNNERFVSTFTTGDFQDVKAPNIKAKSPAGHYNVAQKVSLTPYLGERTLDIDIDPTARIFYTTDGTTPGTQSTPYTDPISIREDTTLKFFGIDEVGNVSRVVTQEYTFGCMENEYAKDISPYPECMISECIYGYRLQNNVCIQVFGQEEDYKAAAATAPLFGSDTPMTISTKPALYITPEHEGVVPRPINFIDNSTGTSLSFQRDTSIQLEDGSPFTGYILPPENLYSKSFPINFGYSFKSIFQFKTDTDQTLKFSPMIEITIPFTDRYNEGDKILVFTYDAKTEEYFPHDPSQVSLTDDGTAVRIMADSTETFFVAQPGEGYNQIVFKDTVNHWAKNYIEQLYRWEMVKGRSSSQFAPDDILTRGEFTKIALNAIGEEVNPLEDINDPPFSDVALYAWYTPYVKRAKELGLINGYPDGTFRADDPINKVEAVKVLTSAFGFDVNSAGIRTDNFQDIPTWEWYFPSLNFASKNNMIDGIRLPNGKIQYDTFGPSRSIKRGEMAKLAVKAIEYAESLEE